MPDIAVILFAHGAKNPEWEAPLRSLAKEVATDLEHADVSIAFLQFGEPKLPDQIDRVIGAGAKQVVILPYFISLGGHLLQDLPDIVKQKSAEYPKVQIHCSHALGQDPLVLEATQKACIQFTQKNVKT
jgi:sirohydrochlorin cobaltochelatase